MKNKFIKILKQLSIIFVILILSVLIDIFGFNFKQFTLSKTSKGIININNYKVSDVSNNKKSIDIKLKNQYINKLVIEYSTKKDIPIVIKYKEFDYYKKIKTNEFEDKIDNETNQLVDNIKNNVKEIHILYDKKYNLDLKKISIDNRFQLNWFRVFFAFSFIFSFYLLYVFYKKGFKSKNLHKYYICMAMLLGIIFIVLQPSATYYSWDDQIHFKNVLDLRSGSIKWNIGEFSMIDASPIGRDSIDSAEEQINQMKYLNQHKGSTFQSVGSRFITYNKIAYIPSAIGYYLAKFLGLPFSICFKMGKVTNLLAFVLIMAYAIKISKLGKRLLCVIGLMPMLLFIATQYSYDSAVISGITLALVILLNWFTDKNSKVDFKSMWLFIVAILYGVFPKAVYVPFILLFLFVPKDRFRNKRERIILKLGIIFIFVLVLYTFVSPASLSNSVGDERGGDTSVGNQLKLIISYPIGYINVLKDTFIDQFLLKIFGNTGGKLAYAGYITSNCTYITLFVLLFVGITDTENNTLKNNHRCLIVLDLLGMILLVWTALYLSFTPVGLNTINGVQARYFIPFIFPLIICFQSRNIKNKIAEKRYNTMIFALMNLVMLLSIYEIVLKVFCY